MTLIALFTAAEAVLFAARHSKTRRTERRRLLTGNTLDEVRSLPTIDRHLRQRTADASRFQIIVASAVTRICRQAVYTRAFEYLLLHFVRTTASRGRRRLLSRPEVLK